MTVAFTCRLPLVHPFYASARLGFRRPPGLQGRRWSCNRSLLPLRDHPSNPPTSRIVMRKTVDKGRAFGMGTSGATNSPGTHPLFNQGGQASAGSLTDFTLSCISSSDGLKSDIDLGWEATWFVGCAS